MCANLLGDNSAWAICGLLKFQAVQGFTVVLVL